MAEATPSAIMADLQTRLKTALGTEAVVIDPPEQVPASTLYWIRYGPVAFDWGWFTTAAPTLTVTVGTPRKGMYPSEYAYITDTAAALGRAIFTIHRSRELLGGQAPITGVSIGEASGMNYAGVPDALMAAVVTIAIETKEMNAS